MLVSVESRSNSARMVDHESPTHLHDAVRVETHSYRPPPRIRFLEIPSMCRSGNEKVTDPQLTHIGVAQ